jgi:lysophospholipid acyltransferase (LPLAT)-like uncharacterized protein
MSRFKNIRNLPRSVVFVLSRLVKILSKTLRLEIVDPDQILKGVWTKPTIYVMWHNRIICIPTLFPRSFQENNTVLASQSRDGNYVSDYLKTFHYQAIRGSSSRGGVKALIQLKKRLEQGGSITLTPDGPRGPKYNVQEGIIWVARKTGAPIIPASLNTERHWELKGWDNTQIPKPFTKAELIFGTPFYVNDGSDATDESTQRLILQEKLMAITRWD